jgi:hypothetical protein
VRSGWAELRISKCPNTVKTGERQLHAPRHSKRDSSDGEDDGEDEGEEGLDRATTEKNLKEIAIDPADFYAPVLIRNHVSLLIKLRCRCPSEAFKTPLLI